jgi:hypothetical protein
LRRRAAAQGLVAQQRFSLFRRAQRAVERRSYDIRRQLLYLEKQRTKSIQSLGLDPYLDLPG